MTGLRAFLAASVFALGASSATAATLDFSFSFTNTTGNFPGTVTGVILGLQDEAINQTPTAVILTTTGGLPGSAEKGLNVLDWDDAGAFFGVAGGQISYGIVVATTLTLHNGVPDIDDQFCLYTTNVECSDYIDPTTTIVGNSVLMLNGNSDPDPATAYAARKVIANNQEGAGIIFTRIYPDPTPVPLPATAGLLGAALLGLGRLRRRRGTGA